MNDFPFSTSLHSIPKHAVPMTRNLPLGGATSYQPGGIDPVVRSQYIEAIKMNELAASDTVFLLDEDE